jgi:CRP-like cAMP-binding protein
LVSAVESALETSLSARVMQGGGKRRIENHAAGSVLFEEGEPGSEVLLVLDGIVRVERGGERLAEYGPGALLGERAHLEDGVRTSTNVAVTPCRVAYFDAEILDRADLEELAIGHRREDAARD